MATRYRFDPGLSRFTVQAFTAGMLSFLGHRPTFAVGDFAGVVHFTDDTVAGLRLEVTVRAASLQLVDRVKDADRREIEGTMHRDVLETAAYPEVRFAGSTVGLETL